MYNTNTHRLILHNIKKWQDRYFSLKSSACGQINKPSEICRWKCLNFAHYPRRIGVQIWLKSLKFARNAVWVSSENGGCRPLYLPENRTISQTKKNKISFCEGADILFLSYVFYCGAGGKAYKYMYCKLRKST
jgi:hypothetical protein